MMSPQQRTEEIRLRRLCYKCFGQHRSWSECEADPCSCGKDHHSLLCFSSDSKSSFETQDSVETHVAATDKTYTPEELIFVPKQTCLVAIGAMALYPIHKAYVTSSTRPVTVFMDGGSNASYVTENCAAKFKLRRVEKVTLDVTTVGGEEKQYESNVYEVPLRSVDGKITKILAYSLENITGPLSPLDRNILQGLFPDHDAEALIRPSNRVDLLIGTDYFGLHPKNELARSGNHLSIMSGDLGICVVDTHPQLKEETVLSHLVPRKLKGSYARTSTNIREG